MQVINIKMLMRPAHRADESDQNFDLTVEIHKYDKRGEFSIVDTGLLVH